MKNLESFVNLYPLSKTLRFALLPIGKTEENFNRKQLLLQDQKRAEEYEKVKEYIDRYHKYYIESVLADECKISSFLLDNVREYAALYSKSSRDDKDEKNMEELEKSMRKSIADILKSDERYALLFKKLFKKEMITELLPGFLTDKDELASLDMFKNFTAYFTGFNTNRKNMYSAEEQSTAIPYRCINDNLPKFLDNVRVFKAIKEHLPEDEMTDLNETYFGLYGVKAEDMFCVDYFAFVLSQSGIDRYNSVIGGYKCLDGTKQKGVNECVNLYNQAHPSDRLPLLKPLYKQILSDKQSISFIPEKFKSDDDALSAIEEYYCSIDTEAEDKQSTLNELEEIFNDFDGFDHDGIFVASGAAVTDISNAVFKDWSAVREGWNREYETRKPIKSRQNAEKYLEKQKDEYKRIKSFSVSELQKFGQAGAAEEQKDAQISDFFKKSAAEKIPEIRAAYAAAQSLLERPYAADKKLAANENAVALLKNLLDAFKDLQKFIKPLLGTGKEEGKDDEFYGRLLPAYENLSAIDSLYDKVRNYVTQKPYSTDKIKLNFENYNLLGGWDKNKETDYHTVILRKGELYYLAIMDKERTDAFVSPPQYTDGEFYDKLEYKFLPNPNQNLPRIFFPKKNRIKYTQKHENGDQILRIYNTNSHIKSSNNFSLNDCHKLIDFFKQEIQEYNDWPKYDFKFSPTESYNDISEFYKEVADQGYKISFRKIPKAYIDELIDGGMLYIFQIYNKDFSTSSHGKQNLHTMYFKMLFDERNIKNAVFKLNGQAEMFYRPSSINEKERITHPAYLPITNKNSLNPKHESTFAYDIIKDRRFTKRQFFAACPHNAQL